MVSDFLGAAFPWILLSLFAAVSCSLMGNKEKLHRAPDDMIKQLFVIKVNKEDIQ